MRFEFWLIGRYFRARKSPPLTRLTAFAAIFGTAFGLASFIIAQSLANGLRDELQHKILANTAHILVSRTDETDFAGYPNLIPRISNLEGVKSASPTTYHSAMLSGNENFNYAVLRAVENFKIPVAAAGFDAPKTKTGAPVIEVYLGQELAAKAGLKTGDYAKIIAAPTNSAAPDSTEVFIGGTFRTGLYEYDSTWIYLSIEDAAAIIGRNKPTATAISVSVNNIDEAEKISTDIKQMLGDDYKTLSWQEANRPLFAAMSLEKQVVLLIISLIILLAVLNITTNLALIVSERRADIAVLQTCGAKKRQIILIFLSEGIILGAIGAALGVVLGLAVCAAGNYFHLISLPPDVYSVSNVRFMPKLAEVVSGILMVLALSFLASVFPARRAANSKPWESLANRN